MIIYKYIYIYNHIYIYTRNYGPPKAGPRNTCLMEEVTSKIKMQVRTVLVREAVTGKDQKKPRDSRPIAARAAPGRLPKTNVS